MAVKTLTIRTDEQLIADVQTVAALAGTPFSWRTYNRFRDPKTTLNSHTIMRRLGVTWTEVCARAQVSSGGKTRPSYPLRFSDEELIAYVRAYLEDGTATGSYVDFYRWTLEVDGRPNAETLRHRLGKWSTAKTLATRSAWQDKRDDAKAPSDSADSHLLRIDQEEGRGRRWACSCGSFGEWAAVTDSQIRRLHFSHVEKHCA